MKISLNSGFTLPMIFDFFFLRRDGDILFFLVEDISWCT